MMMKMILPCTWPGVAASAAPVLVPESHGPAAGAAPVSASVA